MKKSIAALIAVALATTAVCALFLVAAFDSTADDGRKFPPQPDSLLYYQYAKAMAEGHPYRFTESEQPSTGSTSHLFPAILALPYAAGAHGESLTTAGGIIGLLCFIATLVSLFLVTRRLEPRAAWLAVAICSLSGQTAFTVFGQSDMTLFIPLTLAAFAAALHRRTVTTAILLALCALCRPEGMLLAVALLLTCAYARMRHKSGDSTANLLPAAVAGCVAAGCVFLLNDHLTGMFQFQSVARKGYFYLYPALGAVIHTLRDLALMLVQCVFGISRGHRAFLLIPAAGGFLFCYAIWSRLRHHSDSRPLETWFLLSAAAAVCLVAAGSQAGTMYDRHLGWIIPLLAIYAAIGVIRAGKALRSARPVYLLAALLLIYQATTVREFLGLFQKERAATESVIRSAERIDRALPADATMVACGLAGLTYVMPDRKYVNACGITSPAFQTKGHLVRNIELFKHRPELRTDYCLTGHSRSSSQWLWPVIGARVESIANDEPLQVYHVVWDSLDAPFQPANEDILKAVAGMELVDAIDIGYEPHEQSHNRSVYQRVSLGKVIPFATTRPSGTTNVTEVGELVLGSETFTIRTIPGKDLRIVARLLRDTTAVVASRDAKLYSRAYAMVSPSRMVVLAGDASAGEIEVSYPPSTAAYHEILMTVPGGLIVSDRTELTIGGDHIPCAYWFYQ